MSKMLRIILVITLLYLSSSKNSRCKNHVDGYNCALNRKCVNSKCKHKVIMPINFYDLLLAFSLIFGSLASILSGIGGKLKIINFNINND